jgi:hypothetical protein
LLICSGRLPMQRFVCRAFGLKLRSLTLYGAWAVRNYGLRLPHVSLIFHQLQGIVRPEFTGTLAVKSGRHPILERLHSAGTVVPNDVYCDDSSSFQMIHGPKSAANAIAYVVQRSLTDGHFS